MKKIYLYGAGINCIGAIKFFGKENISAVIDSDSNKIGTYIENIPIISFEEYIEQEQESEILITSYFKAKEIEDIIKKGTRNRYYKSPYMQMGYYDDVDEIIDKVKLETYSSITFYSRDPIARLIVETLQKRKKDVNIQYFEEMDNSKLDEESPVIITCDLVSEEIINLEKNVKKERILWLSDLYMQKYGIKNSKLVQLKGIHKGKRCFIIGNGPSLSYQDLEKLYRYNEICFGANRIYLAYENTRWRPDYYLVVDYLIARNDEDKIKNLEGMKFIRHFYKTDYTPNDDFTLEFQGRVYQPGKPKFSLDIENGIYSGNTVIYDAMQIAAYMGFKEIFLLGVDMTSGIRPEEEGAHFYKTPDKNEKLLVGNRTEIFTALRHAKAVLEEHGCVVKNATRGGELEVFDRVDFDSLFV